MTWQQNMTWCNHYTGIFGNKICKAGVNYETVRDDSHRDSYRWPCTTGNGTKTKCALAEFPTEAEAKEEEARRGKMLADFFAKIAKAICPHCDTPVESERQVGRCAYAEPCGCRRGQGRARSADELETARRG